MEFGFGVPTRGPLSSPENMVALANKGEEMGFDIVSVSDHIVIPRSIDSVYPYNESGRYAESKFHLKYLSNSEYGSNRQQS